MKRIISFFARNGKNSNRSIRHGPLGCHAIDVRRDHSCAEPKQSIRVGICTGPIRTQLPNELVTCRILKSLSIPKQCSRLDLTNEYV